MAAGGTLICRSVILLSDSGKPTTMGSPAVRSKGTFLVGLECEQKCTQPIIWVSVAEHCRKTGIDDTWQVRHRREKIRDVLRCGKKAIPHQDFESLALSSCGTGQSNTRSKCCNAPDNPRHCVMIGHKPSNTLPETFQADAVAC